MGQFPNLHSVAHNMFVPLFHIFILFVCMVQTHWRELHGDCLQAAREIGESFATNFEPFSAALDKNFLSLLLFSFFLFLTRCVQLREQVARKLCPQVGLVTLRFSLWMTCWSHLHDYCLYNNSNGTKGIPRIQCTLQSSTHQMTVKLTCLVQRKLKGTNLLKLSYGIYRNQKENVSRHYSVAMVVATTFRVFG